MQLPVKTRRNYVSNSVQQLPPSGIRRYFDIAATMDDVITLGIGEPNFSTPDHIIQAGVKSLEDGNTGYTSNSGMAELRRAVVDYNERLYGIRYDWQTEVLVTVGVSEALFLAVKTVADPGEEVLVVEPCFVSNAASVQMAGAVPVMVPTSAENDFRVTRADIEPLITPRTRAILISYPNNPTGAVMDREHLQGIADLAEAHDLMVISDEIYDRLVYDVDHICFAALPGMQERTILMSGMSKAFAMTGWRIGYVSAPADIMSGMRKLHQYLTMSAPTIGQVAGVRALTHGEPDVEIMRQSYDRSRRLIVDGFNSMGLTCFEPKGAFYAFPDVRSTGLTDEAFCEQLLREESVAVVPGSAFGASGSGFIRASYTNSYENIEQALERMARFVARRR
jgi:aminotransferase